MHQKFHPPSTSALVLGNVYNGTVAEQIYLFNSQPKPPCFTVIHRRKLKLIISYKQKSPSSPLQALLILEFRKCSL